MSRWCVLQESATAVVRDAKDWATLAEREAHKRVSRVEAESVAALASWDHSTRDQGSHTFFEVVGVLARTPSCQATPDRLTWLMSGPGLHSQWVTRRVAWVSKTTRHLSRYA
jgi:hypothetical protein